MIFKNLGILSNLLLAVMALLALVFGSVIKSDYMGSVFSFLVVFLLGLLVLLLGCDKNK